MSVNLTRDKAKIRPGRKSLRSESGSENALRRSQSNRDETADYELAPSPSTSPSPISPNNGAYINPTESTRHIGLNLGDNENEDVDTPPMTPASARSQTKSITSRELPKHWSDDESTDVAETESFNADLEGTPTHKPRHGSAKTVEGTPRSSVQETPVFSMSGEIGKRSSLQDGDTPGPRRSSVQESSSLRPEKSKRSSAQARVSPRADKKAASAYTTLVTKEKLERANRELMQWVQKTLAGTQRATISSWDSFKDGVALILLIHACDPCAVDVDEFDMSDPLRTLEAAFDIASEKLGLPNLFDARALIDARLSDNGPDLRTFILYVSHLRSIHSERQLTEHPLATSLGLVAELQKAVQKKVSQVELLNEEFQEHTNRLIALASQDELQAERSYLQQRALKMDKMMEWGRQLNSELEAQNLALRDQTRLLNDKIEHLTRAIEQEKHEKEAALQQVAMTEKLLAMAELLGEPDLDKFMELHKTEIDLLTGDDTTAKPHTPPAETPATTVTS